MGEESWQDEHAMKYLNWAMKVPCPMISFVTGVGDSAVANKYQFYEAELGNTLITLMACDVWNRKWRMQPFLI